MGSQQLLLLLLGTIVVLASLALGINSFDFNSSEDIRSQMITGANVLLQDAFANYSKQSEYGGGSKTTFANWHPSNYIKDDSDLPWTTYGLNGNSRYAEIYIKSRKKTIEDKNILLLAKINTKGKKRIMIWSYEDNKWEMILNEI